MTISEVEDLAKSWIEYCLSEHMEEDVSMEHFPLASQVYDLADNDPDKCWDVVLKVVIETEDSKVLSHLGAGPLENLLHNYPEKIVFLIKNEVLVNPRIKHVLSYVWQDVLPEEIWDSFLQ